MLLHRLRSYSAMFVFTLTHAVPGGNRGRIPVAADPHAVQLVCDLLEIRNLYLVNAVVVLPVIN